MKHPPVHAAAKDTHFSEYEKCASVSFCPLFPEDHISSALYMLCVSVGASFTLHEKKNVSVNWPTLCLGKYQNPILL